MKKLLIAAALCGAIVAAPPVFAQAGDNAELNALRAAAQKDKRALVATTLKLSEAESKKFWPVYDKYQRESDTLVRQRNRALEGLAMRDRPMTDAYAKSLMNELAVIEEQEAKSRRSANAAVMKVLSPKKAALYTQLEWKLRAVQFYEIAAAFPLAQ